MTKSKTQPMEDQVPTITPLRTTAFRFMLRRTSRGNLSTEAKRQLVMDALFLENELNKEKVVRLRAKLAPGARSMNALRYNAKCLAEHYQISVPTVKRIVKLGKAFSTLEQKPKSGRPPTLTMNHKKQILDTNNKASGATLRVLEANLKEQQLVGYTTQYQGQEYHSPSRQTIWRLLQQEDLITMSTRQRPSLTEANKKERLDWCEDRIIDIFKDIDINDLDGRERFAKSLESLVDVDEMYLVYSPGTGKFYFLPEDLNEMNNLNELLIIRDEWKQNPPKILLFGAVTAPKLLNPRTSHLEGAKFDKQKRGIIQIRRVRSVTKYQRSSKHHKKGNLKFQNCSVSGSVFQHLMIGPKGLGDHLDKYFNEAEDDGVRVTAWGIPIELTEANASMQPTTQPTVTSSKPLVHIHGNIVRIQQDNAGGHGFNNLKGGAPTEFQKRMVESMRSKGYLVYRQPRNSPEFNMLDLGFWNSIKQAVRQRSGEIRKLENPTENRIQAKLWELVKDVVNTYDPAKLFSIAVQKQVLMHECILAKGGTTGIEVHSGVRKFWGL